jgi:hypothetical protein
MTETDLWWVAIAAITVGSAVIAVLLGLLIAVSHQIDGHVDGIWTAAKQVAGNTVSIWMLERTNEQLADISEAARALEARAEAIDQHVRAAVGD